MSAINKVEAVLFASGKAMDEEHIKKLTELKPKEVRDALGLLKELYVERDGALFVWNEGEKWKINVREDYIPLVKSLVAETELDRAVLETLAVVAYRSPVLQSDVIKARGSGAYDHIAELAERGFLTREKFGRSFKIKITDKFYNYFDVADDKEIREVFADIKAPSPEKFLPKDQQTLGQLEVVEAETDEQAEAEKQQREHAQTEIYSIRKQRDEDKRNYLNEFESRLGEVSGRIDTAEGDIVAARPVEIVDEETGEPITVEENSNEEKPVTEENNVEKENTPEVEEPTEEEKKKDFESMDPRKFAEEMEKEIDELVGDEDK